MPEERGNGKPIRQSSDHTSLGKGNKKPPIWVNIALKMQACDEQKGHKYQQCGCDPPHFQKLCVTP
jgi:hypothetical protein